MLNKRAVKSFFSDSFENFSFLIRLFSWLVIISYNFLACLDARLCKKSASNPVAVTSITRCIQPDKSQPDLMSNIPQPSLTPDPYTMFDVNENKITTEKNTSMIIRKFFL